MALLNKPLLVCLVAFIGLFATTQATQALVPSYFSSSSLWTLATSGGSKTAVMIANPNSGPGTSASSSYQSVIAAAQKKGSKVVGYVHITYGSRSPNDVKADIANWYKLYPSIDGIFFDECPATASGVSYVTAMYKVVKAQAKNLVVLNPGVYPTQAYMSIGDILLVFEDTYARYTSMSVPSWVTNYSSSKFYHVVHTCTSSQYTNALSLAKSRRAGYVFITNDVMPNPYDTMPTYWTSMLSSLTTSSSVQEEDTLDTMTDGVIADQENADLEAQAALLASVDTLLQSGDDVAINEGGEAVSAGPASTSP